MHNPAQSLLLEEIRPKTEGNAAFAGRLPTSINVPVTLPVGKTGKGILFPKIISAALFSLGVLAVGSVVWPIGEYQLKWYLKENSLQPGIVSPLPEIFSSQNAGAAVLGEQAEIFKAADSDYSQASNWFVGARQSQNKAKITDYALSIPRLKIDEAHVKIGGEELKKSLIQWGGSAVPGELGNTVIFGHSSLPQFFNPQNYLSIFALLPELKIGDEIFLNYDGITYRYKVIETKTVEPEDLSVLEQKYDNAYLTLITCVPPGTYWKRLVVKARLTKI